MRVVHFDCFNGISGDMVLGAVLDAGVPVEAIRTALDSLDLPITLEVERVKRCGFAATKATITAPDQENYRFLPDVEAIIDRGKLTNRQRELAKAIFRKLAVAESTAHGMPLERVHFHEVGALDSIADIVGSAVGLDFLGVERFTSSSVPTGSGTVKGAHGIMPVPAPGTLALLQGVPLAPSDLKFELTTPTGAAILTTIVKEFTDSPAMTIEKIGTGAGSKDFLERPNILRLLVGTAVDENNESDTVLVLETNLDDVPGEIIGFTLEQLLAAGALDAFCVPIQMKKGRPAVLLSVIATPATAGLLESIIFRETATFGIRRSIATRSKLRREAIIVETPWGPVRAKRGFYPDGNAVITPEYDECARLARDEGVPLRVIYEHVQKATGQVDAEREA